jgi:hypothetical protein
LNEKIKIEQNIDVIHPHIAGVEGVILIPSHLVKRTLITVKKKDNRDIKTLKIRTF